jgi:hypothetical protein
MQNRVRPIETLVRETQRCGFILFVFLLASGCAGPIKSLYPPGSGERPRKVYVINHSILHTGLAVKRSDIPRGMWPAKKDYPGCKYLEVGWGDDDGYRKDLTTGIAVKALLGSRRTVLLSNRFEDFSDSRLKIVEVDLSALGFSRLCRHIEQTYALDESGRPIRLGTRWYRARGTYSAFNTCNTWVASGLRKAGCPVTPAFCLTPGPLLSQVRRFGKVIRP